MPVASTLLIPFVLPTFAAFMFASYITYVLYREKFDSRTVDYPNYLLHTTYEHPNRETREPHQVATTGTDYLNEPVLVNTVQKIRFSPYYDFGTKSGYVGGGTDAFLVGRDEFQMVVNKN